MADIWYDVDAALAEVPVNILPIIDTAGEDIEEALTYDEDGLDLNWNFITPAGAFTQTNVTPTTGGVHDWAHAGNGMYTIEIPASGGTINNDTEGFGWFTGKCTASLTWRGPICGFRDSDLNDKLIESAWSATRGLAGTAVPDAAADAAGGLPISDAGELDLDTLDANITALLAGLTDIKLWSGTFSAANATTITMADEADANAIYEGARVMMVLRSGTDCNGRIHFGTVGASRVITVDPAFTADGGDIPSGTIVGAVYAAPKSPTNSIPTVDASSVLTVLGALDDATATGAATDTDTVMAYVKQLVTNMLEPAGFEKGVEVEDLSWPMKDANGDVVTGETVTMTIQKDGGTPASIDGTIAEIGSTGHYQITTSPALTATEMNADHIYLVATSTNAKPTTVEFWTEARS